MNVKKEGINVNAIEDLFYSPSNIEYLKKVTAEIDAGTAKLSEHELIEGRFIGLVEPANRLS